MTVKHPIKLGSVNRLLRFIGLVLVVSVDPLRIDPDVAEAATEPTRFWLEKWSHYQGRAE